MRPSERLLARLRWMGLDIPEGAAIERTYAGRSDRARGAWSWWARRADGSELQIGSQYTVTALLRERRLMASVNDPTAGTGDVVIDPWQPRQPKGSRLEWMNAARLHEEPEEVGGGCRCWVTPEDQWTHHYGAYEPGSQVEWNPDCPQHRVKARRA